MVNTLLYRGTGKASHATIMGTIHVLDGPLPRWVSGTLQSADRLVLESNREQPASPLLPNGARLSMIYPEVAALVAQEAVACGLDPDALDQMLPLVIGSALSEAESGAFRRDFGVEAVAGSMFHPEKKDYLETAEELFSTLRQPHLIREQVISLLLILDRLPTAADSLAQAVQAWRSGDVSGVVKARGIAAQLAHAPTFSRALLFDRNQRWAPRAHKILNKASMAGESVVFAVGSAHLMEPGSFQAALATFGYTFEVAQ
jgi:uncharacterized protein YbaP (TraB family)